MFNLYANVYYKQAWRSDEERVKVIEKVDDQFVKYIFGIEQSNNYAMYKIAIFTSELAVLMFDDPNHFIKLKHFILNQVVD